MRAVKKPPQIFMSGLLVDENVAVLAVHNSHKIVVGAIACYLFCPFLPIYCLPTPAVKLPLFLCIPLDIFKMIVIFSTKMMNKEGRTSLQTLSNITEDAVAQPLSVGINLSPKFRLSLE